MDTTNIEQVVTTTTTTEKQEEETKQQHDEFIDNDIDDDIEEDKTILTSINRNTHRISCYHDELEEIWMEEMKQIVNMWIIRRQQPSKIISTTTPNMDITLVEKVSSHPSHKQQQQQRRGSISIRIISTPEPIMSLQSEDISPPPLPPSLSSLLTWSCEQSLTLSSISTCLLVCQLQNDWCKLQGVLYPKIKV
jgi:hypothetical protein